MTPPTPTPAPNQSTQTLRCCFYSRPKLDLSLTPFQLTSWRNLHVRIPPHPPPFPHAYWRLQHRSSQRTNAYKGLRDALNQKKRTASTRTTFKDRPAAQCFEDACNKQSWDLGLCGQPRRRHASGTLLCSKTPCSENRSPKVCATSPAPNLGTSPEGPRDQRCVSSSRVHYALWRCTTSRASFACTSKRH